MKVFKGLLVLVFVFCGSGVSAEQTIPLPGDNGANVEYVKVDEGTMRVTVDSYVQQLTRTECVPVSVPYTKTVFGSAVDYQRSEIVNDIAQINAAIEDANTQFASETAENTERAGRLVSEKEKKIAAMESKLAIKQAILDEMDAQKIK